MHDTQQSLVKSDSGNGGNVGDERGDSNGDDGVMVLMVVII